MSKAGAEAALIWCPFPDEASARSVASAMIERHLIACANMMPGMTSLFVWQGARDAASECGTLLKTSARRLDEAMTVLAALHPYDTPAILGWTVRADPGTLAWLARETGET